MSATRKNPTAAELRQELDRVHARLEEDEEILRAIRYGEVDALVIDGAAGQQVFTLHSAETPYRILMEQMHEGAATLTADGTILYCNRRFAEMLGLPQETVVGRFFQSVVAPPDRDAVSALVAEGTHGAVKREVVLETDGGGAVPAYLSINPLTIEGVRCLCLVVTDLTEQKRNEEIVAAERLARSILEHATEAIVVCDVAQHITHASHAVWRLCNGNPIGQMIGAALPLSISRLAGDGEGAGARPFDGWIAAALAGSTVQGIEADLCCGPGVPGQTHRFLVSAGPLYNAQHRIIGCVVTLTDISDRLRAEAALRQSEERLQFALEAARAVAWEWTPESGRAWHSANAGTVMGLGRREVQSDLAALCGLLPAGDWESVRAALAEALREKREFEYEYRVVLADGTIRWMANRGRVIRNEAEEAVRLAGVIIDITERKAAEAALQAKMAELETVLEAVPALVFIAHDRACHRMTGSRYTYDLLGLPFGANTSNSAPVGEQPTTFRAVRNGVDIPPEALPMQVAAADGLAMRDIEFELALADGRCLHVLGNAVPLRDPAGQTCGAVGAFIDITARKQMETLLIEQESRLRLAIDSVEAGIWDWNTQSDQVYLSPRLKGFVGYGEDLPDSNSAWLALVHSEDRPLFKKRAWEVLNGQEQRFTLEYRVRHKDGTYRWIQSHAQGLQDGRGGPVRLIGLDLDITEEKQAKLLLQESEQRLQRLQQQLMQISRLSAIGEVASILAHELNQPLTATINYVQAARRMVSAGPLQGADRLRELMDKAVGQATRAGTIIRRIREFIALGKDRRSRESVNDVVTEASTLGLSGAADNAVTVRFDLTPDLPWCLIDRVQIQQVVFNLVHNALEAMAESPRRELTIRTSRRIDGVEVAVCDTGPGVAVEVRDGLFQPFVTTKANGLGLGLAICRSIIATHDGRLEVAANPKGGAIFRFCLPIAQQDGRNDAA